MPVGEADVIKTTVQERDVDISSLLHFLSDFVNVCPPVQLGGCT